MRLSFGRDRPSESQRQGREGGWDEPHAHPQGPPCYPSTPRRSCQTRFRTVNSGGESRARTRSAMAALGERGRWARAGGLIAGRTTAGSSDTKRRIQSQPLELSLTASKGSVPRRMTTPKMLRIVQQPAGKGRVRAKAASGQQGRVSPSSGPRIKQRLTHPEEPIRLDGG